MISTKDVQYRMDLAKGFLKEAEHDFELKRWRSCVDHAQLSVENSGKAILMLFGISPKTHQPARHLASLIREGKIPEDIRDQIRDALPDFLTLGLEEHFMTDYGDESGYVLPWDLFDKESAKSALDAARLCASAAENVVNSVNQWRSQNKDRS